MWQRFSRPLWYRWLRGIPDIAAGTAGYSVCYQRSAPRQFRLPQVNAPGLSSDQQMPLPGFRICHRTSCFRGRRLRAFPSTASAGCGRPGDCASRHLARRNARPICIEGRLLHRINSTRSTPLALRGQALTMPFYVPIMSAVSTVGDGKGASTRCETSRAKRLIHSCP